MFGAEYPAIYWLEENGYDVSYISGVDTATNGSLLLNHKSSWMPGTTNIGPTAKSQTSKPQQMRASTSRFLSGNEIFWQTRFEPSIDGSGTANRTLVTYKDTHFGTLIDPNREPRPAPLQAPTSMGGAGMPSNALTGTVFQVDADSRTHCASTTITIPYDMTQLRFWRNTSVANTAPGQTASLEPVLLGYEWDSSPDNGFSRPVWSTYRRRRCSPNLQYSLWERRRAGTATHNLVEYRDPTSGALVFGAGTVFWSWGLSDDHDAGRRATARRPIRTSSRRR